MPAVIMPKRRRKADVKLAPRRYEGSAQDEAEDKRGARILGVSRAVYEASARDKREDKAGQKRFMKWRKKR